MPIQAHSRYTGQIRGMQPRPYMGYIGYSGTGPYPLYTACAQAYTGPYTVCSLARTGPYPVYPCIQPIWAQARIWANIGLYRPCTGPI